MGRIWTTEQRQKQSERIRTQKPWTKSTGPRTATGKKTSSQNAFRHGHYAFEMQQILKYLRTQNRFIDTLRNMIKSGHITSLEDLKNFRNELNKPTLENYKNATNRIVKSNPSYKPSPLRGEGSGGGESARTKKHIVIPNRNRTNPSHDRILLKHHGNGAYPWRPWRSWRLEFFSGWPYSIL